MSAPTVYTYYDAIASLDDFCKGHGFSATQAMIRRAVQAAYRKLVAVRDWAWLYKDGRIPLVAPYDTGTIEYVHTGGTYERQLTLTDGTWPSWIEDGSVRIDGYGISDVESQKSSTVVTLGVQRNPGADIDSGTDYTAYRRWYPMPNDFAALWAPLEDSSWLKSQYRPVQDLAALEKYQSDTGDIYYYAIGSGEGLYGSHVVYVSWASDTAEPLCIPYKRLPRTLRYSGYDPDESAGTITVTSGNASVSCSGTTLNSGMIGSILRIGTGSTVPSGLEGLNPYGEQRTIIDLTTGSTETMTLDAAVGTSQSAVAYRITDPVDMSIGAYDALLRSAELQLAQGMRKVITPSMLRDMKDAYQDALHWAKVADNTILQRRIAGSYHAHALLAQDATFGGFVE